MDPRKMEQLMRQMGIQSKEIPATRVVIETEDGNLVIGNPQVTQIDMQGNKSFQINVEVSREAAISEEDIDMVVSQANCSAEDARKALEDSGGDIAAAILSLSEDGQ